MPIDQVNFNKLKAFDGTHAKSFEQLIYQLMVSEYGHLGNFTPIDGQGGDGGIEFYLDLKNGERWGWQCKYYEDNGRLNTSNRFVKIENSLRTACDNHENLTRWFLCLKTDLTNTRNAGTNRPARTERAWFESQLRRVIPDDRVLEIDFIGKQHIVGLLTKLKNIGIKNFFFGELELDQNWFERNFQVLSAKEVSKYEPELHSINSYSKSIIDYVLMDHGYLTYLDDLANKLSTKDREFKELLEDFKQSSPTTAGDDVLQNELIQNFAEHDSRVTAAQGLIGQIRAGFEDFDAKILVDIEHAGIVAEANKDLENLRRRIGPGKIGLNEQAVTLYRKSREYIEELARFCRNYIHEPEHELHFVGDGGMGKTHLAFDIAFKRIHDGRPAIFLTGEKFTNESNLEEALRKLLDIPLSYSLDTFLDSVDTYGEIRQVRIPLVIDGLNETTSGPSFSPIWRNHLRSFANKISSRKNLVLVTTCRTAYKDEIWDYEICENFHVVGGFSDYETIKNAVTRYFNRYRIHAELNFSVLDRFSNPLFLRLYCEIVNPSWRDGVEVEVNIEDSSSHELFSSYFELVNKRVTYSSNIFRRNEQFIPSTLEKVAAYLWANNLREISIAQYYELIDGQSSYNRDTSRAEILLNEGLVMARSMRNGQEYVSITYEPMAAYIISRYLVENFEISFFQPGEGFFDKIMAGPQQHPLFESIVGELALLFPKFRKIMLHDFYEHGLKPDIFRVSVNSLWSLRGNLVRKQDVELISRMFAENQATKADIFELSSQTITNTTHPLNATFLSNKLLRLRVQERDLSWTEYVRMNRFDFKNYVAEFESICRQEQIGSKILESKLILAAEFVQWFLISTDRELRDRTTKALYCFGRKFPDQLISITLRSLECDDPYLWERTLAALYGVCLVEYNSAPFHKVLICDLASKLFGLMFQQNAPFFTTHILARDYASSIIKLALRVDPKVLTTTQKKRVFAPFVDGAKKLFPSRKYDQRSFEPVRMDFSNYTIGTIVNNGHAYSDPPEKKKVRGQIYHRIFELGWEAKLFEEAERRIDNYEPYSSSERRRVERYGKKYSWIAFHEIAGHRADRGLLNIDPNEYRHWLTDIDPSFPEADFEEKLFEEDLLGDRSISIKEWLEQPDFPSIGSYLVRALPNSEHEWVCLDAHVGQADPKHTRKRFTFIRTLLISEEDYDQVKILFENQNLGGRWLPEINSNYNTFAGEVYQFENATFDNTTSLSFVVGREKRATKRGDAEYYPDFEWLVTEDGITMVDDGPETIERLFDITKDFQIQLPVMTYCWEGDQFQINGVGSKTILSKELVQSLELETRGSHFDLFCSANTAAVRYFSYNGDSNDSQNFAYFRKDLLDRYLSKTKQRLLWAVWGEKQAYLKSGSFWTFIEQNDIKRSFVFQKIFEYP